MGAAGYQRLVLLAWGSLDRSCGVGYHSEPKFSIATTDRKNRCMKNGTARLAALLAMVGLCVALLLHFHVPASQFPGDPIVKSFGFEASWRKSDRTLVPEDLVEEKGLSCRIPSIGSHFCSQRRTANHASSVDATPGLDHVRLARAPPPHAS